MEGLRKSDEKELYKKLTKFAGRKLSYHIDGGPWTATEIASAIKTQSSRISEIRKGTRQISRSVFASLVKEGFIKMSELKAEVGLTDKEQEYIDENFGLLDDRRAAKFYNNLKK